MDRGASGKPDRALSPSGTEPLRVSSADAVTIPSAVARLADVIGGDPKLLNHDELWGAFSMLLRAVGGRA